MLSAILSRRSIQSRLMMMAVLTAVLTASLMVFLFLSIQASSYDRYGLTLTKDVIAAWQTRSSLPLSESYSDLQGYIVSSDGHVLYSLGNPVCEVGVAITSCLPQVTSIPLEGHQIEQANGEKWFEISHPLQEGKQVVARVRPRAFGFSLLALVPLALVALVCALPFALLFSFITLRPLARRLHRIALASAAFARGEAGIRTGETARDEIGQLGYQFDQLVATVSQQMLALRELAQQNSQLMLAAEQTARVAERANLSRDLHDTISQHLFSLAMGTTDLAALIRRDPSKAAHQAEQLATIATQAQNELRGVLTQLRPTGLNRQNLLAEIRELVAKWQTLYSVPVTIQLDPGDVVLPLLVEDLLFRICQEGLNNIARHVAATSVSLKLVQNDRLLQFSLKDNGRGFDPAQPSTGLGLVGIQERVRAVGGSLTIKSKGGQGTTLEVTIPLAETVIASNSSNGGHNQL